MSTTLAQLTSCTPAAYLSTLRAFISTLEALIDSMTRLIFSDDSSFGPVERALVLSHLEGGRKSTAKIALFRQANAFLGALTAEQSSTLDGLMSTLRALEEDLDEPLEELEIISSEW